MLEGLIDLSILGKQNKFARWLWYINLLAKKLASSNPKLVQPEPPGHWSHMIFFSKALGCECKKCCAETRKTAYIHKIYWYFPKMDICAVLLCVVTFFT
jgi:hypothetical protein